MIRLHVKIDDHISKQLQELIEIAPDGANEALGKSGSDLRKEAMRIARKKGRVNTGFSFSTSGKRQLVSSDKHGSKQLFSRYGHDTGDKEDVDMAEFVRFKVYDHSHKVLVGFMNVKGWRPKKYRDGRRAGYWGRTSGTMVKEIGELYESGGEVQLSQKQKNLFKASGWGRAAKKGFVERKAHPVIAQAWANGKDKAVKRFNDEFLRIMGQVA